MIFTTGYDRNREPQDQMPPVEQPLIFKPCEIATLSQMLWEQLQA